MQQQSKLPPPLQRSAELASGDDTSSWLTAVPLDQMALPFTKEHFVIPSACAMSGPHHQASLNRHYLM